MAISKKKLTWLITITGILVMLIGTFAYFTDRVDSDASVKTADASEIIKVTPDGTEEGSEDPGSSLEDVWKEKNPNELIKPGDDVDLSYELTNIGDSDIDVKETIILSSSVPLDQADPEYRLFLDAAADKYGAMVGGTVVSAEAISEYQVKYEVAPFSLEKGQSKAFDYVMVFNKYAGNAFQQSTCTIDYLVEMRQHSDLLAENEGWEEIQTATITFAGINNYNVVPAAK